MIGDITSRLKVPETRLAGQCANRTITCKRTHQVHGFEVFARRQIAHTRIRNPRSPAHMEFAKTRETTQRLKAAIGDLRLWAAHLEFFELGRLGEMQHAFVREVAGK